MLKSEYQNLSTSAEGLKVKIQEKDVELLAAKDLSNNLNQEGYQGQLVIKLKVN